MDYVESLRVFRAVVESRGFGGAARMTGLTTPVVSRAVASLERRIGARLIHRNTRQFYLTDAAERFYDGCCRVLNEIELLETETARLNHKPAGLLRLVAHTTTLQARFMPMIAAFKQKYPEISLDVTLTEQPVNLIADGYDVGIVAPFMLATETAVTRLLENIPLVVVAADTYLKEHRGPLHPMELKEHSLISGPATIHKPVWTFLTARERFSVLTRTDIASNNVVFNREMVLQGLGIGIQPLAFVQEDLKAGRLVRLLEEYEIGDEGFEVRLAYSKRKLLPEKTRVFIDHAVACFKNDTVANEPTLTSINRHLALAAR